MSLIEQFVRTAKAHATKLAIIDRATGHRVTYKMALLRSLILARKLSSYEPGFIGVMIPNSAGAMLTIIAALMSGCTPVMINYATGAAQNCRMAQRRLPVTGADKCPEPPGAHGALRDRRRVQGQ
jgi:acyl-[acyl-carrier-protein]-phospholipid O-acyltransferase / long-chain-fatty-acid--[acyl-carrier-protein] ligase